MSIATADTQFNPSKAQIVYGPSGAVRYWLEWPRGYTEHFVDGTGNIITANAFVDWNDAAEFKLAMTGYTQSDRTAYGSSPSQFLRVLPHRCPYTSTMYCREMRLVDFGLTQDMLSGGYDQDPAYENWPTAGWAKYELTYGNLPYILRTDSGAYSESLNVLSPAYGIPELSRYCIIEDRSLPKERKLPSYGYETCSSTPTIIPEVGFVPMIETEFVITLMRVPLELRPVSAYAACAGYVNSDICYGKTIETMLFKGLAGPVRPYPDANGDLYVDLPYVFSYMPNGWNCLPTGMTGTPPAIVWSRVRKIGSASGTDPGEPLYASRSFKGLFKPEP